MRHEAVKNLYDNVVNQVSDRAYDVNGELIDVDETKVSKEIVKLQAEYDAKSYARARQQSFPIEHDLLIALWEKIMENRSESANALQAIRTQIKADNPKP